MKKFRIDGASMAAESLGIDQNVMFPLDFKKGGENRCRDSKIESFLNELKTANQEDSRNVIKEIIAFYTESKGNKTLRWEATHLIIELFTIFNGKKQLKKYLQDLITKEQLINEIIKYTAKHLLRKIKQDKVCDIKECSEFLYFLSVLQTSPGYDFEENFKPLFPLYAYLFDGFAIYASHIKQDIIPEIELLNSLMNAVLKQILPIFVKTISFMEEIRDKYMQSLLMFSYILLFNERIGFDLRMKVCLIFVYSFNMLEGETTSVAQLISKKGSPFNMSINEPDGADTPKDYYIILYSSILSVLPEEKLINEQIDGKSVLCALFEGILETAKSNSGDSAIIVETSRTLCQVAKHLKSLSVDLIQPLLLEGFFFVSSHSDHFIDTVRNYSKMFFEELVAVAAHHYQNGVTELTTFMMNIINDIPENSTMKFYAYENIAKFYGSDFLFEKFDDLPSTLLKVFSENKTLREQICKTYQFLVEKCYCSTSEEAELNWAENWVLSAGNMLKEPVESEESEAFSYKIIDVAFKLQPAVLRMIYPNGYVGTEDECKLLLHCLHNARKNGIEVTLEKDSNLYWRGLIDKQKMDMYMIHQNKDIRLLVLASVTDSLKSTELYLDWELMFLINFIRFNITVQSPSIRKQIISCYKKVLARYDAGLKVIQRNITNFGKYLEANIKTKEQKKLLVLYQELKKSYKRFLHNLIRFLIGNLSCDSNFPRRTASLELLLIISEIVSAQEWHDYWTPDDVQSSHNILFDTYESNKKMIVKLFKTLPPHHLGFMNTGFTFRYMQRCIDLSLDVKPSKTMAAAYLFEVCSFSPHFYEIVHGDNKEETKELNDATLDMIVVLTRKFLIESYEIKVENIGLMKTAVYGLILSIRHLLENRNIEHHNHTYAGVFSHLASTCINISEKILPIVCNPSPEGYLPDNVEDIGEHDDSSKAQTVLVYAWRTIKEITLLLAELVKQSIKLESQLNILPKEVLIEMAQLFVNVFLQSKHRGVFEQAYVGFSTVCEYFWKSNCQDIASLPKKWLQEAVELCTGKKHSNDLCSTRRSAGLPFLILSILTTDRDPSNFHNTVKDLLKTAEDYDNSSNEIRTHCMNVLRAVFRHSKLSELVSSYVARGVILAITGFKSPAWGVRNSSTLLFAALMTRMFGVQRSSDPDNMSIKNKLTVKVFFMRYQELYTFILNSLIEECNNKSSLVLQPILMILSRLYPSSFEESPHKASEYLPYIEVCLKNPVYRIKEAAAKASVALINISDVKQYFDKCFHKIANKKISDNECHGILLQMSSILRHTVVKDLPLSYYLQLSSYIWENAERRFSFMTINLYTELVTKFLYCLKEFDDLSWLKQILLHLSKFVMQQSFPFTCQGNFALTRIILAHFIMINKFEDTDSTYSTVNNEIMSILYAPRTVLKKSCLQMLICLNQMHEYYIDMDNAGIGTSDARQGLSVDRWVVQPHPNIESHALFKTGDVEINSDIRNLIYTFRRSSIKKILKHIHPYLKGFLMEELKIRHYIREDDRVLLFLLVAHYPCAIKFLRLSKQETLNTLLGFCRCDNEELISAVISCISIFLVEVDYNLIKYDELLEVLSKSASPAAALHRRLAVCDFLCNNDMLYCNGDPILKGAHLSTVLNIVMVLLEDDDWEVRNAMSNFENALKVRVKITESINDTIPGYQWPVVPEKAKEDLINLVTVLLPHERAVCLIFSWACRFFPDHYAETCELQIFERGGLNEYAENTPLIDICSKVLVKMLWKLPDGLSYDDKSIFPEEQTQIVTATLLNALIRYDSPMMLPRTKVTVISGLKSLYTFLDNAEISDNFVENFRKCFNEKVIGYLTSTLQRGDHFCVIKFMKKLYDPLFRQRR